MKNPFSPVPMMHPRYERTPEDHQSNIDGFAAYFVNFLAVAPPERIDAKMFDGMVFKFHIRDDECPLLIAAIFSRATINLAQDGELDDEEADYLVRLSLAFGISPADGERMLRNALEAI